MIVKNILRSSIVILLAGSGTANANGFLGFDDHCTDCYVRQVTPALFQTAPREIIVRRPRRVVEHVPARYQDVTENVQVRPERVISRRIAAVTETRHERVMVKPARREWQHQRDAQGRDVLCLVDVPALFEDVPHNVVVQPARVEQVSVPAQYRQVTRKVKVSSARNVVSFTAPVIHTIPVQVHVSPKTERWVPSHNPDHLPHSALSGRF